MNRQIHSSCRSRSSSGSLCAALFALASLAATAGPAFAADPPADAPENEKRLGYLIRIPLPLTGDADSRIKSQLSELVGRLPQGGVRPAIVLQFYNRPDQAAEQSEFSRAMALAEFLAQGELARVQTVAYLPESTRGHAVLVAMACEEIYMAPGAEIGDAGVAEARIQPAQVEEYRQVARRRKTIPEAIALAMLDPSLTVLRVETEVNAEFILDSQLEELSKRRLVKDKRQIVGPGQFAHFTGREARRWGIAKRLVDNREALARSLELSADSLTEDPSLGDAWRPILVSIEGAINGEMRRRIELAIEESIRKQQANFVCVRIDSAGGDVAASVGLANYLASLDSADVRTAAYVAGEALDDAAIVAAACDHVILNADARLGGSGADRFSRQQIDDMRTAIEKGIAPSKSRSWSLLAAMIDPQLTIYRYTRSGTHRLQTEYFCEEEWKRLDDAEQWERHEAIVEPGKALRFDASQAVEHRAATAVVDDFEQFKRRYSIEGELEETRPGWALELIEALAQPGLSVILLIVAMFAMYAELHTPGVGIGGFISAVCFLLFFWSRYLGHSADWLEALLFLGGCACLAIEVFVLPGFGIFGLGGGAMVLASLVLASQTFIFPRNEYQIHEFSTSLTIVGASVVGFVALAAITRRYLPHAPLFNRVMLHPPGSDPLDLSMHDDPTRDFQLLLDKEGVAITRLNLSGRARFGDEIVHVLSDGEAIEANARIVVVEVRGAHVVVRRADDATA